MKTPKSEISAFGSGQLFFEDPFVKVVVFLSSSSSVFVLSCFAEVLLLM